VSIRMRVVHGLGSLEWPSFACEIQDAFVGLLIKTNAFETDTGDTKSSTGVQLARFIGVLR
jgi:hypothetical protein